MSWEEKMSKARQYKANGNAKYKAKEWKAAVGQYHRALLYVKGVEASQQSTPFPMYEPPKLPEEVKQEAIQLRIDCYNNLAACLLQFETPSYDNILSYCDNVLEVSPQNVKALYRKGVSLYHMKNYEDARNILLTANKLPAGQNDGNIRKYLQLCKEGMESQEAKMKKTYKQMFKSRPAQESESQSPAS